MDEQKIEAEIKAKGLTAPRVTPDAVDAAIAGEEYAVFSGRLTVCVLTLTNGFLVTGESSCVDAANFDADLGKKLARQKARDKIWELEGYRLRQKIAA
jgi:hypothetical protein